MQFSSIQPIDMALSGATTPGQSGHGGNGNEGVRHIPQNPCILEPLHQIVKCHIQDTYWGGGSYPSAEVQSVYFTVAADWETN